MATTPPPAPATDLPGAVRAACAWVATEATHVRIDAARLPAYVAALPLETIPTAEYDLRYHFRGTPEETAAFVLTLVLKSVFDDLGSGGHFRVGATGVWNSQ